jgi:site-specific DNA-methyltransferase (adenine-specific)
MIHIGDCLEVMKTLDAESIDAIVTDPPYGMKWDPDCRRFSGGSEKSQAKRGSGSFRPRIANDENPFDPSPWVGFPKVVMFGCNHFGSRLPVGTTLVWIKKNEAAYGTFLSDAELAWMKGGHGVYCFRHGNQVGNGRKHPTQKPVAVMQWIIRKLKLKPGSTILDPYCGSGSTGVAAIREGHKFIGIELNPEYAAIAEGRIQAERDKTALLESTA